MDFYERKSGLTEQEKLLLNVFTDLSCSEVRPEATTQQISGITRLFHQCSHAV